MENKKAFVVYTNWKQYIDELTDEEVGMWTRWMFDYCNDKWLDKEIEYPNNSAVKVLCKLTKDILKQDLVKYKNKKKRIDDINERKRVERETKSQQCRNDIDNEIVNDIDNQIDDSNKLLVISNKIKEVSKDTNNNIVLSNSNELSNTSAAISQDISQAVIILPCLSNYNHPIFEEDIKHYKELYPAVNILQELKKMLGWLESNPRNRKTKSGIKTFITRWLSKVQDKAPKVEEDSNSFTGFRKLGDDDGFGGFQQLGETDEEYYKRTGRKPFGGNTL